MDLDVYLVPVEDEHFNEIISPADDRVKELSGFTGEYGTLVMGKANALFTSYQYREMAPTQLKSNFELVIEEIGEKMPVYLYKRGVRSAGIYTKTISSKEFIKLEESFKPYGITLVPLSSDLVDEVWTSKPQRKYNEIFSIDKTPLSKYIDIDYVKRFREMAIGPPRTLDGSVGDDGEKTYDLNQTLTGDSSDKRIKGIQSKLKDNQGLVVSSLSSIGWLTNLRGTDITYSPNFYSFLYMTKDRVLLFTAKSVTVDGIDNEKYSSFYDFINQVPEEEVLISGDVNYEIYKSLKKPDYTEILLKEEAKKNNIELFGYKNSGVKDGAAMVRLFAWIEMNIDEGLTEKKILQKLIEFKSSTPGYFSESFEPLVASGSNSAKIYHKATNRVLERDEILLIDTGTHYYHGTTDLTRTLVFGKPSKDIINYYTIVLKSLIDAKFLAKLKITGKLVDRKARKYLKQIGKDYPTSTGHSVGYFGQVHEKLPKINYGDADELPLFSVYTLEPTYYDENMGIRIEDMVYNNIRNKIPYQLNLTYVPLDLKLIDPNLLSDTKLKRLNVYSTRVRQFLTPLLKEDKIAYNYLIRNTEKLEKKSDENLFY